MDQLNDLLSTYGVKLLYYDDTTDGYRDITDSVDDPDVIGQSNSTDVHQTPNFGGNATPHLHVRFTSFNVTQDAKSHLRFTLEGVTTT